MKAYGEAVESAGHWDEAVKKLALYRAGWLAKGLKDYETADRYLTELAGLDFGYKDVSALLDEVSKHRENGDLTL
ncbi:MAG: hypothetical protein DWQ37_04965 [Planctomycetota bacterium]|nr:MAG: hypothetical protein DWQ37_04965 [Planctomycetota bacterium]